jgi:hypothetical protein
VLHLIRLGDISHNSQRLNTFRHRSYYGFSAMTLSTSYGCANFTQRMGGA